MLASSMDAPRSPVRLPDDLGRRLDPIHGDLEAPAPLRFAAVVSLLLPDGDGGERLLLIERSRKLRSHAGQLAFPGGKPESSDRDLLDTALREANEEVGLPRGSVSILGRLDPVPTPTGFMIVPFVGRVERPFDPVRQDTEVHRILTPSLAELTRPEIHRVTSVRHWKGVDYPLHQWDIGDPPLWGATARMVWDLLDRAGLSWDWTPEA